MGAYINQNSGNLVICLKEDSKAIREMYYSISGADKLEFKKVKYSLNELFSIARQVNNYAYLTGKMPQIESSAIIQKDNRVECYTSISQMQSCIEHSYDNKEFFVDNFEYKDAIIFKASDGLTLEASAGGPGYGINTISSSGSVGSIGYLAYRNNGGVRETGFVTAGHVIPMISSNRIVYNSNGERIGFCTFTNGQFANGNLQPTNTGNSDVAFVKIDSGTTISTTVRGTSYEQDMSIQNTIPAERSTIYKSGSSTGVTHGVVYSLYYNNDTDYLNGPFVKRILATYTSARGDSGGIVYAVANGKARVVGIHQGSTEINGNIYAVVVTAYVLQNDLQNPIIAGR